MAGSLIAIINLIPTPRLTNLTFSSVNGYLYALQDANWNITALADAGGSVVERYLYTPYGVMVVMTGAFGPRVASAYNNPYTFTGRRYDAETGFFYFRMRYYASRLGVFISRDPKGPIPDSNLYAFTAGRPLTSVDPLGLSVMPQTCEDTRKVSYLAVCKFSKTFGGSEWLEEIPCESKNPFACCAERAEGFLSGWHVVSARLKRRVTVRRRCYNSSASVAVACDKCATTPWGATIAIAGAAIIYCTSVRTIILEESFVDTLPIPDLPTWPQEEPVEPTSDDPPPPPPPDGNGDECLCCVYDENGQHHYLGPTTVTECYFAALGYGDNADSECVDTPDDCMTIKESP